MRRPQLDATASLPPIDTVSASAVTGLTVDDDISGAISTPNRQPRGAAVAVRGCTDESGANLVRSCHHAAQTAGRGVLA